MSKNFLILMSGGTTPVINSTLASIIKRIRKKNKNIKIFSGRPGIIGATKDNFLDLSKLSDKKIKVISQTPGSHFIGTSRLKKLSSDEIKILEKNLKKRKIKYVINIGGNGTLQQTIDLSHRLKNINFAACPKTVDNDLGDIKLHKMLFNPGFISCVKIWQFFLQMINIENIGAQSHDKVIISQTFGRDTGFICGSIRLWDQKRKLPIMLLLPEDKQSFKTILFYIKKKLKKYGRLMIFMSEGYNLQSVSPKFDQSGQVMYGSSGTSSCQILNNKLNNVGIQSRIFNPTILQRVFKYNNTLVSSKDIRIARQVGSNAVDFLLKDKKSFLISISNKEKIYALSFDKCKNFSRKLSRELYLKKKFDVSNKYIKYLKKVIA